MPPEEAKYLLQIQVDALKSELLRKEAEMLWHEEELRSLNDRLLELEHEMRSL